MGQIKTVTLSVGETMTEAIAQNEKYLAGLTTGSIVTSASLTFLGSLDGVNFQPIYNESAEVVVTTASYTRSFALTPSYFYPWTHIKIVSGNSGCAIVQEDYDAEFKLVFIRA